MAVEIRVPPLGESLVDAVVGQWLKEEGDAVSRGETILELETDKVNLDVTASDDGEIGKIERKEGDVVEVGDLLATLNAGSSAGASNGASAPAETAAEEPTEPVAAASAESESAADTETAESVSADGAGRAAPAVRRLAEEHHIDLANLSGTGPGGRVTREDVIAAASDQPDEAQTETATAPPPPEPAPEPESAQPESKPESKPAPKSAPAPVAEDSGRPEERVRMTRRRQTIANRLVEAQHTAAMLTTFNEIDMSAVMALRSERKEAFKEEHGVNLGFMSFFTKATVGALKAFPYLNAEIDGDEIVLKHYYDVGIAVGVEEGLVVPVLRDADRKNFAEIESGIRDLAVRAQEGTLELSELMGGTFTITNGGVYGSLMSTPILNTPQVGILGMHAIQERPVAIDGKMVIRPMMYVALSYDHRIVDGGDAVRFLVRIKEFVEDPTRLLLEG